VGSNSNLADFYYNRDGKRGKTSIVWGVITDQEGYPLRIFRSAVVRLGQDREAPAPLRSKGRQIERNTQER